MTGRSQIEFGLYHWRSGVLKVPPTSDGYFSQENWGDVATADEEDVENVRDKVQSHFTRAQKLSPERWNDLLTVARPYIEKRKKVVEKRRRQPTAGPARERHMLSSD